jgi:DNA-directed RNA polymerase subunit RPC12/RpoP
VSLAFACPSCGASVEASLDATTTDVACGGCGARAALPEAAQVAASRRAEVCPVCGSTDLYQQRDFNRVLGLSLVAIGVLSGPFTRWISTVAFVALDAVLYLLVPTVAVCYACEAQQRGFDRKTGPKPFEIAIHDAYRFGKRFPPRRARAVAGPRARLLLREGKDPAS